MDRNKRERIDRGYNSTRIRTFHVMQGLQVEYHEFIRLRGPMKLAFKKDPTTRLSDTKEQSLTKHKQSLHI